MTAQGESTALPPLSRPEVLCPRHVFILAINIPAGGSAADPKRQAYSVNSTSV
jgi:hypothetical protein